MESVSPVTDFYRGKNILITGVTGYVSKGVVEKLLYSCEVGTIYLLIRPKRNKDAKGRLEDVKKNLVFERLKSRKGTNVFNRLVAITGDVGEENLGLSETDRKTLIENVDIVLHAAATLDFDLNLKEVVNVNLLGTRRMVELCSEMKRLKAMVYVSTAYVNSNRDRADEILYEKPGDVEELIEIVTNSTREEIDRLQPKLIKDHPNSYTITKAYAEHELSKATFPTTVVRPSQIVGAWQEPVPGWTDSKNGPTGFCMGASKGVIRRLPISKNLVYDYIPVDVVINEIIVAGWHAATTRPKITDIFHCTSSTYRPFSWKDYEGKINLLMNKYPLEGAIWYPSVKLLSNFTLFRISTIFLHFLPALFFDAMLILSNKKPILVRLHLKVNSSLCRLAPFIYREWFFDNTNSLKLFASLAPQDKEKFNIDIAKIDYDSYFENGTLGIRRYLNREEISTLQAARKKHKILRVLNYSVQILAFWMIWWMTAFILGTDLLTVFWILPVSYLIFSIL